MISNSEKQPPQPGEGIVNGSRSSSVTAIKRYFVTVNKVDKVPLIDILSEQARPT